MQKTQTGIERNWGKLMYVQQRVRGGDVVCAHICMDMGASEGGDWRMTSPVFPVGMRLVSVEPP